ncbi:hypothetical protein [Bifidobacterium mongoliense]|uniref:hypothetical protein n=1 Tax=Bifidobacterium mongoliense TaxID=518643 RepID=UPI002648284D|nr:hypothetical protein [Bifidobacterium mongoliense]MDN5980023.1 PH domain-containing protein [Bifidobacterium mongoliense]MDN6769479.1 PH domain-containing protein [Bifidobacterium mongoliense]MDN6783565.1 PH domain-containing protein [Bifidobacterium mongoliense]
MANRVAIVGPNLEIEPLGVDKVWSLTGKLIVPMEHVVGATEDPGILDDVKGLRAPGLHIPGKWAGTFTNRGERVFWNVTRPERPVVIQLKDERYSRLVLGVEDPHALVDLINAAIARQ